MDAGWQWVPPRGFARADEPVVLEAARPGRFRRRMVSDDFARQPPFYHQPGGFLIPDDGLGMQRSRSIGHRAPPAHPPVVINNFAQEEVPGRGRPISVADDFMDIDDSPFSPRRFREHSRPRGRAATSREPSPFQWQHEMETEQIKKELEVYKKKEERKAEEERIKNELLLQRAKEEQKKRDDEAKRKIIEEQAVVEWQRKERERIEKEKQEKEKRELEYKDRLQKDFGLTETQVAKVVTKENNTALDLRRTTHTKIARRHISLETLRVYDLPYQLDDVSFYAHLGPLHRSASLTDGSVTVRSRTICGHQALGARAPSRASLGTYPTDS